MADPYYSASDIISIIRTIGEVLLLVLAGYGAMKAKIAADQSTRTAVKTDETEGKVTATAAKIDDLHKLSDGKFGQVLNTVEQQQERHELFQLQQQAINDDKEKLITALAARLNPAQVTEARAEAAAPPMPRRRAADGAPAAATEDAP